MRRMLVAASLTALVTLVPQGALAQGGPSRFDLIPYRDVVGTIIIEGGAPFQILSIDFKITTPSTIGSQTGGAGAGKATFSSFTVTKAIDASSPAIFQASIAGTHFATAILTLSNSSMTVILSEVMVSSLEVKNDGTGVPTLEQVGFEFAKVEFRFPKASSGAQTPITWNLSANAT